MSLSKSEENVVTYLKQGYSNQEIANKLFLSVKTIKFHLTNIFKKYDVKSRSELIVQLNGYTQTNRELVMDTTNNKLPVQQITQKDKIQFIDQQFKVGESITQLHHMMKEVTKQDINPATVNAACNCVARLNETINTAIQAAKFLNER